VILELRQEVARAVLRAVIDDHDLFVNRYCLHSAENFLDGRHLIVGGHHDRKLGNFRHWALGELAQKFNV